MRERLRRLAPPSGPQYDLFNGAVAVWLVALIWYVLTGASASTQVVLDPTLYGAGPPRAWGVALSTCGFIAVICSYRERWTWAGYWTVGLPLAFWVISLAIGVTGACADGDWYEAGKTAGTMILWGHVLQGLLAKASKTWVRKEAS